MKSIYPDGRDKQNSSSLFRAKPMLRRQEVQVNPNREVIYHKPGPTAAANKYSLVLSLQLCCAGPKNPSPSKEREEGRGIRRGRSGACRRGVKN